MTLTIERGPGLLRREKVWLRMQTGKINLSGVMSLQIVLNNLLNAESEKDVMTSDTRYRWSAVLAAALFCPLSLLPLVSDLNLAQQDPAPLHPRNSFIHALNKPRWLPNVQCEHNSTAKFNSTAE